MLSKFFYGSVRCISTNRVHKILEILKIETNVLVLIESTAAALDIWENNQCPDKRGMNSPKEKKN